MKTPRYSFRVVIEQDEPQQNRNFGAKEDWAETVRQILNRYTHTANVVEVKPIRNR